MSSFAFTGFNGLRYTSTSLPDDIFEHEHYLIVASGSNTLRFFCFDDNITVSELDRELTFECSPESCIYVFNYTQAYGWTSMGATTSTTLNSLFELVYCSENLMPYRDLIITNNFTLPVPEVEVNDCSLVSIVGNIQSDFDITSNVFNEIFGILPVLLVVLISFIGIRKGISWLLSLSKHF